MYEISEKVYLPNSILLSNLSYIILMEYMKEEQCVKCVNKRNKYDVTIVIAIIAVNFSSNFATTSIPNIVIWIHNAIIAASLKLVSNEVVLSWSSWQRSDNYETTLNCKFNNKIGSNLICMMYCKM